MKYSQVITTKYFVFLTVRSAGSFTVTTQNGAYDANRVVIHMNSSDCRFFSFVSLGFGGHTRYNIWNRNGRGHGGQDLTAEPRILAPS